MEKLISISEKLNIQPNEKVFVGLLKFFTKSSLNKDEENRKACVKIFNGLLEHDDGIARLVEYKRGAIVKAIIKSYCDAKSSPGFQGIEDILEMLHVVAETSEEGNEIMFQIAPGILDVINENKWLFSVRLEACKLFNLLVESVSSLSKEFKSCKSYQIFIEWFGRHLAFAGDYELQATLMEALFRLVTVEEKLVLIKDWFKVTQLQNSFMSIRNEEFETDCRRFLNQFNSSLDEKQRVYTFAIATFNLGRYQLRQPADSKITDFWFDINLESKSLSTFVHDESSTEENPDWEMVCIKVCNVKDFRVNVNPDKIILILKLFEPACQLVPFAPNAPETYVKIIFKKDSQVIVAISKLFGHIKYVELPVSSPSISSTPAKHVTGKSSSAVSALSIREMKNRPEKNESTNIVAQDQTISSSCSAVPKKSSSSQYQDEKPSIVDEIDVSNNVGLTDEKPADIPSTTNLKESSNEVCHENNEEEMAEEAIVAKEDENVHFDIGDSMNGNKQAKKEIIMEACDKVDEHLNENKKPLENLSKEQTIGEKKLSNKKHSPEAMLVKEKVSSEKMYPEEIIIVEKDCKKKEVQKKELEVNKDTKKEKSKKKKVTDNKKVKKLFNANVPLFQDSPDDNYKAVPLKHQEINFKKIRPVEESDSQEEKPITKKMMKLTPEESVLKAAFDFTDDTEETGTDNKTDLDSKAKKRKSNIKSKSKVKSKRTKVTAAAKAMSKKEKSKDSSTAISKEATTATRSSRRLNKKVNYKEPTGDTFEDVSKNELEDEEEQQSEVVEKRKKSVSFVSPVAERSYYEVESDQSSNDQVGTGNLELERKPKHERSPNSKLKEKEKLNVVKQERVAAWTEKLTADIDRVLMTEEEEEETSGREDREEVLSTPSPHDEIDLTPYLDTPWSKQKEQKQKIRKEYKTKKINKNNKKLMRSKRESLHLDSASDNESDEKRKSGISSKKFYSYQKSNKNKRKCEKEHQGKYKRPKVSNYIRVSDYEEYSSSSQNSSVDPQVKHVMFDAINTELIIEDVPVLQNIKKKPKHFFDCTLSPSLTQKGRKKKKTKPDTKVNDDNKIESSFQSNDENVVPAIQFDDETPMDHKKHAKLWPHDLKKSFEHVDPATLYPRPVKKKLWKSPVVQLKEDSIPDCSEDTKRFHKSPLVATISNLSPVSKPRNASRGNISHPTTPLVPSQDEQTNNFVNFCKNMVEQSSYYANSLENDKTETLSPIKRSPSQSPVTKKKKVEEVPPICMVVDEGKQRKSPSQECNKSRSVDSPSCCAFIDIQTDVIMKKHFAEKSSMETDDDSDNEDSFDTPPLTEYETSLCRVEKPLVQMTTTSDLGNEVQSLLQSFGSNINKNIDSKRNDLERFINKITKLLSKKLDGAWTDRLELRKAVDDVFYKGWTQELDEWHTSVQTKQNRLSVVFEQLQKTLNENSTDEQRRIRRLKNMMSKYNEKKQEVVNQEKLAQGMLQDSIRSDIKKLKANMLRKSKAIEIINVRRSLQAMLHNV